MRMDSREGRKKSGYIFKGEKEEDQVSGERSGSIKCLTKRKGEKKGLHGLVEKILGQGENLRLIRATKRENESNLKRRATSGGVQI